MVEEAVGLLSVPGFAVERLLGAGGTGEVWLARDEASGERVALKRVRPGAGLPARDRLRREAAALAGVAHDHVLRLRSVVGLPGGDDLVLVLDAAPGGSLARLVARRGPLSPGEVVTVLVPLAHALAAVHGSGLAHGDVTPANVLFGSDGRPLLSDLGVARLVAGPGPRAGTPGFADPAGDAGPASDVHGLAATCLHALTGQPPYDRAGTRIGPALPAPVGSSTRSFSGPDRALVDLSTVLETALDPDPDRRPSPQQLAAAAFATGPAVPVRLEVVDGLTDELLRAPGRTPDGTVSRAPSGVGAEPLTEVSAFRPVARPAAAPRAASVASPTSGRHRHRAAVPAGRRAGRRAVVGAVTVAAAVSVAAATGIAWAGAGGPPDAGRAVADPQPAGTSAASVTERPAATTSGTSPPEASTPVAASSSAAAAPPGGGATWAARLRGLDAARARAFAAGDDQALAAVYATGSPAGRRDRATMAGLRDDGLRAVGLRTTGQRVVSAARDGPTAVLVVSDVLEPYDLVQATTGRVVESRAGRPRLRWEVMLRRTPDGWAVYDVSRLATR